MSAENDQASTVRAAETVAFPARDIGTAGVATLDTKAIDLVTTDFRKVYDVYLFRLAERSGTARLFIALFSAPWVVLSGLGITKVVNVRSNDISTLISSIPPFVLIIFLICGFLGLIPFHRFWAAHCQQYKMIRYLNNFRKLYYTYFEQDFQSLGWVPRMEADPDYPRPRLVKAHWSTMSLAAMYISNVVYVTFATWFFDPNWIASLFGFIVITALHVWMIRAEYNNSDLPQTVTGKSDEL